MEKKSIVNLITFARGANQFHTLEFMTESTKNPGGAISAARISLHSAADVRRMPGVSGIATTGIAMRYGRWRKPSPRSTAILC